MLKLSVTFILMYVTGRSKYLPIRLLAIGLFYLLIYYFVCLLKF